MCREPLMLVLTLLQGGLVAAFPHPIVIAVGLWWNSNTIAHNFIHRPFFRRNWANGLFAAWLSLLLGVPQALWRDRHLAHHAGIRPRLRISVQLMFQLALVLGWWSVLARQAPRFFLSAYLPGYLVGLGLCALHGFYEHARGTTSHYGNWYNRLCFNDGYHVEHHANPGVRWTDLPRRRDLSAESSRLPAPLRWMEDFGLEALERIVLLSPRLQRLVLRAHLRAFRRLTPAIPPRARVAIVGGGVFPRTALILQRLLPEARLTIIDACRVNLDVARKHLPDGGVEFVHARFEADEGADFDLVVIPLAFVGDRRAIYAHPPAGAVVVHDWIWKRQGAGSIVSWWMLKRLNLVRT